MGKLDNVKVLNFGMFYFRLPDNFNGTIPDAIRLLANYLEPKLKNDDVVWATKKEIKEYYKNADIKIIDKAWGYAWKAILKGKHCSGVLEITQNQNGKMVTIK